MIKLPRTFKMREMPDFEMPEQHQWTTLVWIHFYKRFKQNPACRKTGVKSYYNFRVINAKIKPFHSSENSCHFNNLHWGLSICWHFCSGDGGRRDWPLISEEFTWPLEELRALGSNEEAWGVSWRFCLFSLGLKMVKGIAISLYWSLNL